MANDFESLKQQALLIKNEVEDGANTAERVGGILDGILDLNLNSTAEYNVSKFHPTSGINGSNKYTLETAIAQVPSKYRTVGIKCAFVNEAGKPETWKYQGGTFTSTASWTQGDGSGGNKILEWKTDAATTRKQVPLQERKKLLQISYENAEGNIINEQYIGTSFIDLIWSSDNNWINLPNESQINDNVLIGQVFNRVPWKDGYSIGTSSYILIDKEGYSAIENIPISNGDTFYVSYSGSIIVTLRDSSKKHLEVLINKTIPKQSLEKITINNESAALISISKQTDKNVGCTLFQRWEDKLNVEEYYRVEQEKYNKELPIKYEKYLLVNEEKPTDASGEINSSTGEETTSGSRRRTDFISIVDKEYFLKYIFSSKIDRQDIFIYAYNESKEFLGRVFRDEITSASIDRQLQSYYLKINDLLSADAYYFRIVRHLYTDVFIKGKSNKEVFDNHEERITDNSILIDLLKIDKPNLLIGKNKYKRGTGLDSKVTRINEKGEIVGGNGNSGVTAPIRIKEGETLRFSNYRSEFGYAALYDVYDKPIAESVSQSDTLTWVEGAVYARWTSLGVYTTSPTNSLYCYNVEEPLYAWEEYREYIDESLLPEKDEASYRFIDVHGDSIGSQIGAKMAKMNELNPLGNHVIRNKCVGGESCLDTLAHIGIIPYAIEPFTIPSDASTVVNIKISPQNFLKTVIAEDGETKTYINTFYKGESGEETSVYGEGINPWGAQKSFVNGILGNLLFKRASPSNRENFGFQRLEAGEEVVIDSISYAKPATVTRDAILVCFMGTNGGWFPIDIVNKQGDSDEYPNLKLSRKEAADILVNYYKQLATLCAPQYNDYVFLGFYMTAFVDNQLPPGRIAFWDYFDMRMEQEFGFRYLNVRKYLREYGWKDAGYKLGYRLVDDPEGGEGAKKYTCLPEDVESDKKAIQEGRIPWCIVNGESGVHMLSKPAACVANQVFKRLFEIGAISEYRQIDISTIKDAANADINEPDYGG